MKQFNKIFGIMLLIGGFIFIILSELIHYVLFDMFHLSHLNYFLYLIFNNIWLIGIYVIVSGGIVLLVKKPKLCLILISVLTLSIIVWSYNKNKLNTETSYEPLYFSFEKEYNASQFFKEMESQGFRKVLERIEKYDEDKDSTCVLDFKQMINSGIFPYKFVRSSKFGYEEEVSVSVFSDQYVDSIPLLEREITSIVQAIYYCNKIENCGKNNYQELKTIFDKHFNFFKNKNDSWPDNVSYPEYRFNVWAGGYGKNSTLVNKIKNDLIQYRWNPNEKVGHTTTLRFSGKPDDEIDKLSEDNKTITVLPYVCIDYSK